MRIEIKSDKENSLTEGAASVAGCQRFGWYRADKSLVNKPRTKSLRLLLQSANREKNGGVVMSGVLAE